MGYTSNLSQVKQKIKEAEERTLEGIGVFLDGEATTRCPVDTGNLRSSINYRTDTSEKSVTIGTPVEYGIWVEKGRHDTVNYHKQPFLEPAVTNNLERIRRLARELMSW